MYGYTRFDNAMEKGKARKNHLLVPEFSSFSFLGNTVSYIMLKIASVLPQHQFHISLLVNTSQLQEEQNDLMEYYYCTA